MRLHGLHHLTAVTADARGNHEFYTRVLGMRLVKKTVNQDDTSAYHLFYADGLASWLRGYLDWERRTPRYRPDGSLPVDRPNHLEQLLRAEASR